MAKPSSMLTASPDHVDLWLCWPRDVRNPAILARCARLLNEEEIARWGRFHFEKDRLQFLLTRVLVRTVLSRYAPVAPADWTFSNNAHGRPKISSVHPAAASISFNISHNRELIALAVTMDRAIGVDIEANSKQQAPVDIANHHFAKAEVEELNALSVEERPYRFFEYWTLKEAYIKARGLGLSIPLDKFSFELARPGRIRLKIAKSLNDRAGDWRLWQFQPDATHVLALCVNATGGPQTIRAHRFTPFQHDQPVDLHHTRVSDLRTE